VSGHILEKYSNVKYNEKPSTEPSCSKWKGGVMDGQTDVANLLVAFRNFANAPYKGLISYGSL